MASFGLELKEDSDIYRSIAHNQESILHPEINLMFYRTDTKDGIVFRSAPLANYLPFAARKDVIAYMMGT